MKKINNILFCCLIVLLIFLVFGNKSASNEISSVGNIWTHILLIIILLITIINNKILLNNNKGYIITNLCLIIFLVFSLLINNGGYGSVEAIATMGLILIQKETLVINKKMIKWLFRLFFCLLIITSFMKYGIGLNPNTYASNCFITFLLAFSCFNSYNKKFNKKTIIMNFIMYFCISYASLNYECRNIFIVSSLGIIAYYFLPSSFWKKRNKKTIIWFTISILSLLIVYFYVYMYNNDFNVDLSFINDKGFFSGRERIWINMWTGFTSNNILFGIGSKSIWYPTGLGAHNYMYNILILFGITTFICFEILLYGYCKKLFEKLDVKYNLACLISIISIFLTEFFEASLIGSTKMGTLLILTLIFYSINSNKVEGESDKCKGK